MATLEAKLAEIENIGKTLPPSFHKTVRTFICERTEKFTKTQTEILINLHDLERHVIDELYDFLKKFDKNRKKNGIWQEFKL